MKKIATLLLFGSIMLLYSCSSTMVLTSWESKEIPSNCMDKVLVIGIMNKVEIKDRVEQEMVKQFTVNGVDASIASDVFGPATFKELKEEQVVEKLKGSGYTSVMIISLLDSEKEREYTPGYAYPTPGLFPYDFFYFRYLALYDEVYVPGYYTTVTNYILGAEIYSIQDNKLIYSSHLKINNPDSQKSLATDFSKAVIKDLRQERLIR